MIQIVLESPELERFVQDKVAGGAYGSPEEVIAAALSLLQHDPDAHVPAEELEVLRRAIHVGIGQLERGDCASWSAGSMKAQLRDALRATRK